MKKILLGMLIGFLLATALAIPATKWIMTEKYRHGFGNGRLNAQAEITHFLHQHLPVEHPQRPPKDPKDSFITKPGGLYIVETESGVHLETTIH